MSTFIYFGIFLIHLIGYLLKCKDICVNLSNIDFDKESKWLR